MATYKSFADLTEQQIQQLPDEDSYKKFMDSNVMDYSTRTTTLNTKYTNRPI